MTIVVDFLDLVQRNAALYSDVDGTLMSSNNEVSPVVRREIEQFVDAGFQFTLATGRNFAGVRRLCSVLPVTAPLVLCNGAYVYDLQTNTDSYVHIPADIAAKLLSLLSALRDVIVYIDTADREIWVSSKNAQTDEYAIAEQLSPRLFTRSMEVLQSSDVVKVGLKVLSESKQVYAEIDNVFATIDAQMPGRLHYCFSNPNYVEFMAAGVSKWSGIQTSQHLRGTRADVVIAVGDEHNDVEMVTHADIGVAMGNAVDAVKRHADISIGRVEYDGLADFLRYLRLQNRAVSG